MEAVSFQCAVCRHRHTGRFGWACDAFPDGIPQAINEERHDHRQPYPGDQGIRFEPDPQYSAEEIATANAEVEESIAVYQALAEGRDPMSAVTPPQPESE